MRRLRSALRVAPLAAVVAFTAQPPAGTWSCTSYAPGPTLGSMGYLFHMEFTLRGDGRYQAGNEGGRYAYDAGSGRITWTDGPNARLYSDTRLTSSRDGRTVIKTKIKDRTYECGPKK